jgi:chromosomal replication initiator protein
MMERVSDLISIDALSQNSISSSSINSQNNSITSNTLTKDIDSFCSLEGILENALIDLKKVINEKIFTTWFNDLKLIGIEPIFSAKEDLLSITLGCPNKFSQEHLKHQYSKEIEDSFEKITGSKVSIKIENLNTSSLETVQKNAPKKDQTSNQTFAQKSFANLNLTKKTAQSPNNESNLNTSYNFSNFVVGSCNQFAQAACIKVSETPGKSYNPLLIYGGVGLGKTHLANAVGNSARRRNKKVLLVSSEKFVSELISSLKTNTMDRFKSRFRSLDILIIDDIQFIIGKERTQEEFFHTFNELYSNQKQIIITSDKLPQDLIGLEERLRTRFASGLSVDLQAPDFETRVAILIKKAENVGLTISYEVAKVIASRIDTNVRELEGALTRLQALHSLLGKNSLNESPSLEMAQKVVDAISPIKLKEITTDSIKHAVARQFNVSINDLTGKRRTQNIALARQVAMFLCRKHTARSFPEIGAIFGGRDHSTVIHAIKTMNDRMISETSLQDHISSIIKALEN